MSISDYHVFKLPDLSIPEPEETIQFTTLDNDLADGYYSKRLFGSNTGLRRWTLSLPTLASLDVLPNTVLGGDIGGLGGAQMSREQYIWDLYCETQITGEPFVYQSPRNSQFYLVTFADENLSYQRMRVKLYSTGIELKQVRVRGETVFQPAYLDGFYLRVDGADYDDGTGWLGGFTDVSGDIEADGTQNGEITCRFNVTTNDGFAKGTVLQPTIREAFFAMKMREATFSNNAGILTDSLAGGIEILTGSSGTTKFTNPSLSNFTYRLNGVEYAQSDMQAPMNTFGIVHIKYTTGWTPANYLQVGRNRETAGTYAEVDFGEIILCDTNLTRTDAREVTEYLAVRWGVAA